MPKSSLEIPADKRDLEVVLGETTDARQQQQQQQTAQ